MITIIIGVIVEIILFIILLKIDSKLVAYICCFFMVVTLSAMIFILSVPSGDYTNWVKQDTIQLTNLYLDKEDTKYVKECEEGEFIYRYIYESDFGTEEILKQIKTNEDCLVEIIENDNYTAPYFETYIRNGENGIWTLCEPFSQIKYIFYVPSGTVIDEKTS